MREVLAVYLEYFLIVAEQIAQFAYGISMPGGHCAKPARGVAAAQLGEGDVLGLIGNHGQAE